MDYFAGLDISMDETHVCVLDREGVVVRESKTESTAQAIAPKRSDARGREQTTARICSTRSTYDSAVSTKPPCAQLTPSSAERARRERRHPKASTPEELPTFIH
jgi:hypothetical protein